MNRILINDKLNNFINDPGIQLTHTNKDNIVLKDIFVFPELRHSTDGIVSSKKLLNISESGNKVIISGPEDSGKTTLIKVLIKNYLEASYYPIYIDAENLRISDSNELLDLIDREYTDVYDKNTYQDIRNESKNKKVIFIDNLHNLNTECIVGIEIFNNVILTQKTPLTISCDSKLKEKFPQLPTGIKHFEILEFNDELRLDLIQKWKNIGLEKESNAKDITAEVEKTKNFIDTVVGHKLAPSYPIFLLTILQMNNYEEEQLSQGGSYSHYYEYLITKPLHISIGKENINKHLDLLSKLSYYMFGKQKEVISHEELVIIFSTSLFKGADIHSYSDVLEILIKSETLIEEESFYRFKYQYAYHYFVAKYLSDNINSETVKDYIRNLCSKLGNDDSANIILFMTHLCQDTFIIDELMQRTEFIFSDTDKFSIEEDSSEMGEFIEELSKLGTKDRKLKEQIVEYSSRQDGKPKTLSVQDIYEADNLVRIVKQVLQERA